MDLVKYYMQFRNMRKRENIYMCVGQMQIINTVIILSEKMQNLIMLSFKMFSLTCHRILHFMLNKKQSFSLQSSG